MKQIANAQRVLYPSLVNFNWVKPWIAFNMLQGPMVLCMAQSKSQKSERQSFAEEQ